MSDATPAHTLLTAGIAAARAGDLPRARSCLLQVVQADERDIQAWYWLSRVVETDAEREVCLENVLALDPGHRTIQAELAALRRRQAEEQAALLAPAPMPATPEEILVSNAATEPLPCPYCGTITAPLDRACPACSRPLWLRGRQTKGHSIYSLALVLAWLLLANYAWLALCSLYLAGSLLPLFAGPAPCLAGRTATVVAFLTGAPLTVQAPDLPLIPLLLAVGAGFVLSLAVAAGLYVRLRLFYWLTVGLIIAASLGLLYQAITADRLPLLKLAIDVALFLLAMSLVFMAADEFAWRERRLAGVVDPDVDSDSALYSRGRQHAAEGMWARAAAHWARAVALNPGHPDYRLALASALIRLGQADRAHEHLAAVQRIEPGHPQLAELLARARS